MHASEDENPDLLWAHRGGGGNFGVVTSLELRVHEVGPMVYGGLAAYDPEDGAAVATAAPRLLRGRARRGRRSRSRTSPRRPSRSSRRSGRAALVAGIAGMWTGPIEEGEPRLRELLEAAQPIVNLFGEMPYAELQSMIDDPPGKRNWWTAEYLDDLPDDAVERVLRATPSGCRASFTQSLLVPWGGAVARNGGGDAAGQPRRRAGWCTRSASGTGAERDVEHIAWGREGRDVFAPWKTGATYLNFVGDEGADRVRAAFGAAYDRLAAIKATWDPDNVFRGNQNIVPAGAPA